MCIRFLVKSDSEQRCLKIAREAGSYFKQFSRSGHNELIPLRNDQLDAARHTRSVFERTTFRSGMLLTPQELSAIVKHTRDKYATPIAEVEDQFRALHAPAGPTANRHRSQRSKEEAQEVLANTVLPEPGDPPPVPDTSGQQFPAGFETGRGGEHHQELQSVIKRMSESYGFQPEIEKPLPDGGRVDVSLKSDELCSPARCPSRPSPYETTNVLKCLAAGYDYVCVVVSNQKKLGLLKSKLYSAVSLGQHSHVKAFDLSGLLGFLRDLTAPKTSHQKREGKPPGQRLNFAEACEFFGIGRSTLYRWIREGRVPFFRPGREYQFDRNELVLLGRQDLSGKRKAVVKLGPLTIEKTSPPSKKEQDARYRKMLKLD